MSKSSLVSDARGASRVVIDLTLLVTDLVETMHHNIARTPGIVAPATYDRTRGITGFVYRSVRGVTRLVGAGIDTALAPLAPLVGPQASWPGRMPFVAALNGVLGDYLHASGNPLAIPMQLCVSGTPVELTRAALAQAVPAPRGRVVVMAHGLCMSDLQWARDGHDHGRALAHALDASVLYLRYNSGRHVSENGEDAATLFEALAANWPVPLTQFVFVGHSMGGLVLRSACATAQRAGHAWPRVPHALVFLGTPHHGAPLERGGHGVDLLLAASPYTAAFTRLSRMRSAGITDLRHGSVRAEDWHARNRFAHGADDRTPEPLPEGVRCFAIAGSLAKGMPRGNRPPRGDGLVPVASALGRHADPRRQLAFAPDHVHIAFGTGHLDLLGSRAVAARMGAWLQEKA